MVVGMQRVNTKEKVIFTTKGVRVIAPNFKNPEETTILDIQTREVIKVVLHFSKQVSLVCIYLIGSCFSYIRESLDLNIPESCKYLIICITSITYYYILI